MTWVVLLAWLRTNWQGLVAGVVIAMAIQGWRNSTGNQPQVLANATATTAIDGGATAHSGASIEIPARPGRPAQPCPPNKICPECPECPAVKIVYDCGASVSGRAASGVTATAAINGDKGMPIGVAIGAGYRYDKSFEAIVGGKFGDISVDVGANSVMAYRVGVTWAWMLRR